MPKVADDYPKKENITIVLEPHQMQQINTIISMQNRKRQELIRELIAVGLRRYFDDPYSVW